MATYVHDTATAYDIYSTEVTECRNCVSYNHLKISWNSGTVFQLVSVATVTCGRMYRGIRRMAEGPAYKSAKYQVLFLFR